MLIVHILTIIKLFLLILLIFLVNIQISFAETLNERWSNYPFWHSKPTLTSKDNDLIYPKWIEGKWTVTNILIDQIAPLAPEIITPGFNNHQKYLKKTINFQVQFIPQLITTKNSIIAKNGVVADRPFNGLNIGKAYLGENILNVKIDPHNINRQITYLSGNRKLISTVIKREGIMLNKNTFLGSELTQQIFKTPLQIYLNEVETTTKYKLINKEKITAEQITAIYLSPQDPDYFKSQEKPVALYNYHLELNKINEINLE